MHLAECGVGHQTVVGKDGAFAQGLVEDRPVVIGGVILGQGRMAARQTVVLGEQLHPVEREDARLRRPQGGGIDVRCIEDRAVGKAFLLEQDRQRIEFLAPAAARDPNLERRVCAQVRDDLFAYAAKIGRIAEHLADLHGQIVEQPRQHGFIAQNLRLHLRDAVIPPLRACLQQTPLDRRLGVMPEIVVIVMIDRIQQQPDLDVLDALAHRGIQTRTRDSSLSTSSGLDM